MKKKKKYKKTRENNDNKLLSDREMRSLNSFRRGGCFLTSNRKSDHRQIKGGHTHDTTAVVNDTVGADSRMTPAGVACRRRRACAGCARIRPRHSPPIRFPLLGPPHLCQWVTMTSGADLVDCTLYGRTEPRPSSPPPPPVPAPAPPPPESCFGDFLNRSTSITASARKRCSLAASDGFRLFW